MAVIRGRGASNKTTDPRLAQASGGSQSLGQMIGRANTANPEAYAAYSRSQRAPQFIQPGDGLPSDPRSSVAGADYAAQFQASLARDRAAIDQQLKGALEALQGRRDQAAGLIATLPQTAGANYDEALGQLQGAQAQGLTGLSSDVRVEQDMTAPLVGALQANKAGSKATQPFLNLAATARHDQSAAGLESAGISAQGDLSAQERQFIMQQQAQQQEVDHFREQMAWEREKHYSSMDFETEQFARQQDAARNQAFADLWGITADEADAIKETAPYRQAAGLIAGTIQRTAPGKSTPFDPYNNVVKNKKMSPKDVAKLFKSNTQLLSVLLSEGLISTEDLAAAGITIGGATAE